MIRSITIQIEWLQIVFLIIGTHQHLTKVHIENLLADDASAAPVAVARNLGTWFDNNPH